MKVHVVGIKVHGVTPTYKQMLDLSQQFTTDIIENNGSLQIKCKVIMQPFKARLLVKEILNCSFGQIRIKYHEKQEEQKSGVTKIHGVH